MTIETDQGAVLGGILEEMKNKEGALLPVLHALQDALGYIPPDTIDQIAAALRLTRAEVHGVISFYHDFRTAPAGRHLVRLCRAEACQAVGARGLESHAKSRLGLDFGQTSADGMVTLEATYCLGNCACGPSLRIGNRVVGRVTAERFDQLVDDLENEPVEVR